MSTNGHHPGEAISRRMLEKKTPMRHLPDMGGSEWGSADIAAMSVSANPAWDAPQRIVTPHPSPITMSDLGPVLGPFVREVAEESQVPTDMVVNMALPTITTAAGGAWRVKVRGNWHETLALAGVALASSGERKSSIEKNVTGPLKRFESEERAVVAAKVDMWEARRKLQEERISTLKKKAVAEGSSAEDEDRYYKAIEKLRSICGEQVKDPRWVIDNATPEVLDKLLGEHGGLGVISSEPGIFGILAGRYSGGAPNIENFLKATSGDSITVDRIGRETVHIENPALSIAACMQPGRLKELANGIFRDSGLLARLCFVYPDTSIGHRSVMPPTADEEAVEKWAERLVAVARKGMRLGRTGQMILTVSDDALSALDEFRIWLEPNLNPHYGDLASIADFCSKLPGTMVRIAGALTLLENEERTVIDVETMRRAIGIGMVYLEHAKLVFSILDPRTEKYARAEEVAVWLRARINPNSHGRCIFKRRTVHDSLRRRAWCVETKDLDEPFKVLIEFGHIRRIDTGEPGAPGRKSELYELNPTGLDIRRNA